MNRLLILGRTQKQCTTVYHALTRQVVISRHGRGDGQSTKRLAASEHDHHLLAWEGAVVAASRAAVVAESPLMEHLKQEGVRGHPN